MRKLWFEAARQLAQGKGPKAPSHPDGYKVRSGNAVTSNTLILEDVMIERFGDVHGHLGTLYDEEVS
jgi:hypothetical protein